MIHLEIFLIIYFSISSTVSQWYGVLLGSHFTAIQCKEQYVSSLFHCAALGRESKDVRFFINIENKYCRWNCTYLYTKETQNKEWKIYGIEEKRNAAYMRPSSASSVYGNNPSLWGTRYATDGLHSFRKGTEIFASEWEIAPWITITLDGPLVISFVRVYNIDDGGGDRFHDVAFEMSMDGVSFERRGFFKGPGVTGQVVEILFDNPTIGKFIRLRISQGSWNLLNLAEIEVYTT
nr:uncharacterized protein LOC109618402 [Crassostrea gigas]